MIITRQHEKGTNKRLLFSPGRNGKCPSLSDTHAKQPLVPASDHLTHPKGELERLVPATSKFPLRSFYFTLPPVHRAVKLLPTAQLPRVVHRQLVVVPENIRCNPIHYCHKRESGAELGQAYLDFLLQRDGLSLTWACFGLWVTHPAPVIPPETHHTSSSSFILNSPNFYQTILTLTA